MENNFLDITGQKFGALTAIDVVGRTKYREKIWRFRCDCGNEIDVLGKKVRKGVVRSCGCNADGQKRFANPQRNLIGKRFGTLTVIEMAGHYKNDNCYWSKVRCDCGNEFFVRDTWLVNGVTYRCSKCFFKTISKYKHKDKRLYSIWNAIRSRCYNTANKRYKDYGGRGIKMCDEWKSDFDSFYEWAIANGYRENLTIDRVDNDCNYEPSNCRWATNEVQANNKRTTRYVEYNGEKVSIQIASKLSGIHHTTIIYRLNHGWDDYSATHILPKQKRLY